MASHHHQNKSDHIPELLAPAGSPEAFRAAVAAGADAVYLGGKRFGARRFAQNFSETEIEDAVRYAHAREVRTYVTVNTLVHDRELAAVTEYLLWLYSIGVDAVLVQDLGVASLARGIIPDLPLHASTQMTIHNTEGVMWAAGQGFSRVVLARELSLGEIEMIKERTTDTGIGLEIFAHGALCYGYSGQCLLSSVIGGRSGNRGSCAQPCRKPYIPVIGKSDPYGRPEKLHDLNTDEHYLLSTKDLCTYRHLRELCRTGITSLKIEGRMKSQEYVSIVVSTYRRALDACAEGTFEPSDADERDLRLAFNRGFTFGYLSGARHAALMGRDAPDNRGIAIGIVTRYIEASGTVSVRPHGAILPGPGDGILFSHAGAPKEDWGFSLNNVPARKKDEISFSVPRPVKMGARVYLTSSRDLDNRARRILMHPPEDLRHKVPIDIFARVDMEGYLCLEGVIHRRERAPVAFTCHPDIRLEPAHTHPLTGRQAEEQLKKTGGTPFAIRNFSLLYNNDRFIPLAELNRARREFLSRAEEMLVAASLPSQESVEHARRQWRSLGSESFGRTLRSKKPPSGGSLCLALYADSITAAEAGAQAGCDIVYFEPEYFGSKNRCGIPEDSLTIPEQIDQAAGICREAHVRFAVKLPRITRDDYLGEVLPHIRKAADPFTKEYMVENIGTARALIGTVPSLALDGSSGLNVFNFEAVRTLSTHFRMLTLSCELSREQIRILTKTARSEGISTVFGLIVQGTNEAVISEDCLAEPFLRCAGIPRRNPDAEFFGIRDETGRVFPVRIDGECRSRIGNAQELCLIDHLPSLLRIGIGEVAVDARGRTGDYAEEMTRIYREAVGMVNNGAKTGDRRLTAAKERARRMALGGITAGHFLRGLKEP